MQQISNITRKGITEYQVVVTKGMLLVLASTRIRFNSYDLLNCDIWVQNRHVVLITNVKPGKLRDVMSAGLVCEIRLSLFTLSLSCMLMIFLSLHYKAVNTI